MSPLTPASIIFSLNLSLIPTFHLENAVASAPGMEPFAVAPMVMIVAYSLLISVVIPALLTKLEILSLGLIPKISKVASVFSKIS